MKSVDIWQDFTFLTQCLFLFALLWSVALDGHKVNQKRLVSGQSLCNLSTCLESTKLTFLASSATGSQVSEYVSLCVQRNANINFNFKVN